jgi:hypothetical protein
VAVGDLPASASAAVKSELKLPTVVALCSVAVTDAVVAQVTSTALMDAQLVAKAEAEAKAGTIEQKVDEGNGDVAEAEIVDSAYTEEELAAMEDEYRWDWGWVWKYFVLDCICGMALVRLSIIIFRLLYYITFIC